jgi:hypothetical protein
MRNSSQAARSFLLQACVLMIVCAAFALPLFARAQAKAPDAALRATVRAELLSDPRTASLSQAQLDAMVNILTQQAQQQGLTAHDITWHPQTQSATQFGASGGTGVTLCGSTPAFSCIFDLAFGFLGLDVTIPFALGVASMGLVWVLAEMIHRRRHPNLVR